jgi:hypothetical protein
VEFNIRTIWSSIILDSFKTLSREYITLVTW